MARLVLMSAAARPFCSVIYPNPNLLSVMQENGLSYQVGLRMNLSEMRSKSNTP